MLFYSRQDITDADIKAVENVLRGELITTGPIASQFEQAFAEYIGAKHAVVVCNGTAALHLAMLVAGIGPGDRVVTSPNTFLASANCAAFVGATPDFSDIDKHSYNLCPEILAHNWRTDTRAVIPVHYAGGPADMPGISEVAHRHGAIVIEDACHALGGSIDVNGKLKKIGQHNFADITTFSFHPAKTMTSGEGGMLVTNNDSYAELARKLRTHGMERNLDLTMGLGLEKYDERGPWYYEMQELGYNMRITDFQCALGISQLSRLDKSVARRREIVALYNSAFSSCEYLVTPTLLEESLFAHTSWHLYTVLIDFEAIGLSRSALMAQLRAKGIATQVLYIPVHLQPWYRKNYGYGEGKCPIAEEYYTKALSLPLYPSMTDADVDYVIGSVLSVATAQQWLAA